MGLIWQQGGRWERQLGEAMISLLRQTAAACVIAVCGISASGCESSNGPSASASTRSHPVIGPGDSDSNISQSDAQSEQKDKVLHGSPTHVHPIVGPGDSEFNAR